MIGQCGGRVLGGNFDRTVRPGVDNGDEIGLRHRRQDAGVVLAEVANADDGHAGFCCHQRPTIEISATSAAVITASPSSTSVRPASMDNADAPAACIAL